MRRFGSLPTVGRTVKKNHVCGQNRLFAGRTTGTTLNEAVLFI
jgi:hypothetical protein